MNNNTFTCENTDWALVDFMTLKHPDEYKPDWKKPVKKDFKGQWIGYYFQDVAYWYDSWKKNIKEAQNKQNNFWTREYTCGNKRSIFREWRDENIENIRLCSTQIEKCENNSKKWMDSNRKEMKKQYQGTNKACGRPDHEWQTIV
jgi:hypothetical protein